MSTIDIPEEHQNICKEFAKIAAKYKLRELTIKYTPDVFDKWGENIHMVWSAGRHGIDANKFRISSEFRKHVVIDKSEMRGE